MQFLDSILCIKFYLLITCNKKSPQDYYLHAQQPDFLIFIYFSLIT